ncbi:sensor histidine kinase [Treponema zioleckii]|uniref:sensor histidine kinase n=1 Tax=Treponema zioleckii TaxID=331680 RepID=UPI00168B3F11|nr:sensor histidine kinase [Treponema zioleckii]
MTELDLQDLTSALSLYTSFFIFLVVLTFAAFIILMVILIHNIKSRKNLKDNRQFIEETIAVQEEERRRISQELHDTVSQNIKALLLSQKELKDKCTDEKTLSELERIVSLEKKNQKELRAIIQNLAVPALASIPFKTVINDLCEQFYAQSKIPCKFFVAPDLSLDDFATEQKHHILRIIQEALNNVQAHAKADETSVVIRRISGQQKAGDLIRIMIFDDGQGFDSTKQLTPADAASHFGMSGMEMRAKLLDGTLTVNSSPDTGTEVRLEIPVQ